MQSCRQRPEQIVSMVAVVVVTMGRTQSVREPALPILVYMIVSTAFPESPGKFSLEEVGSSSVSAQLMEERGTHRGPEHRMRMMLKSQPIKPVPMTAMKIAEGAAKGCQSSVFLAHGQQDSPA